MYKTIIAGITAASLTLATATPAHAQSLDEDQIGKILFGLVATAVIASIIDNQKDETPEVIDTLQRDILQTPQQTQPRVVQPRNAQPWGNPPRFGQPRHAQNIHVLPSQCFASYQTGYGAVRMFVRSCMRENYRQVAQLPFECTVRALTTEGPRNGWDPKCLRENGYRISRLR